MSKKKIFRSTFLRGKKLWGEGQDEKRFMVTVPGMIYKFVAPMRDDETKIVISPLTRFTIGALGRLAAL